MKRVVSVSLGTSTRDKIHEATILGVPFRIERRGTDGDLRKFKALVEDLDGHVDALGIGGADLTIATRKRRFTFRQIAALVKNVRHTPVVDGSGLKHTLERRTLYRLQKEGHVDFQQERALLVSAVDRHGMAQALDELCPDVVYGDLYFGLGLPVPVRSYRAVETLASLIAPIVTQLPFQWFYPTGEKQEARTPKYPALFAERTFLCGDWHFLRRYAPDRLDGKTLLTQTLRAADIGWLRTTGLARAITTTPEMGGETFATNVMEGVVLALLGKRPEETNEDEIIDVLTQCGWRPNIITF